MSAYYLRKHKAILLADPARSQILRPASVRGDGGFSLPKTTRAWYSDVSRPQARITGEGWRRIITTDPPLDSCPDEAGARLNVRRFFRPASPLFSKHESSLVYTNNPEFRARKNRTSYNNGLLLQQVLHRGSITPALNIPTYRKKQEDRGEVLGRGGARSGASVWSGRCPSSQAAVWQGVASVWRGFRRMFRRMQKKERSF